MVVETRPCVTYEPLRELLLQPGTKIGGEQVAQSVALHPSIFQVLEAQLPDQDHIHGPRNGCNGQFTVISHSASRESTIFWQLDSNHVSCTRTLIDSTHTRVGVKGTIVTQRPRPGRPGGRWLVVVV